MTSHLPRGEPLQEKRSTRTNRIRPTEWGEVGKRPGLALSEDTLGEKEE